MANLRFNNVTLESEAAPKGGKTDKLIDFLFDQILQKIVGQMIDKLAPHVVDLTSHLFLLTYIGLEKLSDWIHESANNSNEYLSLEHNRNLLEISGVSTTDSDQ